jgi:hypothetical protein
MRHAMVCALALLAALPGVARSGPAQPLLQQIPGPLRLSEILAGPARDWDGSGTFSTRDDEWVEVRNAGASPLDLTPYFLTDADSIPRFAFSGALAPGERVLVTGRASYDWERASGYPAFGLSLANSGDGVLLWQVAGAETLLVDRYDFRSHEAAADRSVARPDDGGDWMLFDGLNPYTGTTPPPGTGCTPTPAAANVCGTTPARAVSWGSVKSRFR